jgi:hypothetical protein
MKPRCKLTWIIEDRLFFLLWPETVDTDVIQDYTQQVMAAMDASKGTSVHYISDTRLMKGLPSLKDSKQVLASFKHSKMGWTISLSGVNPALRMLVQVLSGTIGIHVRTVADIDEALQFLNESDRTLPPLGSYKTVIETLTKLSEV